MLPSYLTEEAAIGCRTHQPVEENIASAVCGSLSAGRVELLRRRRMRHNAFGGKNQMGCVTLKLGLHIIFFLTEKKKEN